MTDAPSTKAATGARGPTIAVKTAEPGTLGAGGGTFGWVRWAFARWWVAHLMWSARHWPWYARTTKPWYVRWAWRTSRAMRNGTLANARWILGPDSSTQQRRAMGMGVVASFYEFIFEMGRNEARNVHDLTSDVHQVEGREHYDRARALKRGAIIATAHLGSFETGVASLKAREPHVHVVFRRDEVAEFERLRSLQRRRLGVREQPLEDGFAIWLRLREALARDEVVLVQADRVLPGQRGVRVPFCKGHLILPVGPIKLALTTGAPIIPVFSIRTGPGLVRIFMEPAIMVEPGDPDVGGVHPALAALAAVIEKYVTRYPEQWLMVNPVFWEDTERTAQTPRRAAP